jgi:hypothetical protein
MFNNPQYEQFKKTILSLGPVIPGTLRTVYLRCGKKNCRCQTGKKKYRHGPYSFWDRKEGKRLSSRSIPSEMVEAIQDWIKNRRGLENTARQMLQHGVKVADKRIDIAKKGRNLRKD